MAGNHGKTWDNLLLTKTCTIFHRQWLPVSKVQLLGENKERDQNFISKSGQSKASVLKAYERSIDHLRQIPQTPSVQEPKLHLDDTNGTQLTVDGSNRIGSLSRCIDSDDAEP